MEDNIITKVKITSDAMKAITKLQPHIARKLRNWVTSVEINGIDKIKRVRSWRDEILLGKRLGQRSIRLSKGFRAIYIEETIVLITIIEVHNHEY